MARFHGRCLRGERLRMGAPHGYWKPSTFVAGLTLRGCVAPFVFSGPINREAFETWVEQGLVPELRPGDIVVLDNLSSHKVARARALIKAAGARLLFLPPTARTSIPSRMPSPSSRPSSARLPSVPSKASGQSSAEPLTQSHSPSAPTTSAHVATIQTDRILLQKAGARHRRRRRSAPAAGTSPSSPRLPSGSRRRGLFCSANSAMATITGRWRSGSSARCMLPTAIPRRAWW